MKKKFFYFLCLSALLPVLSASAGVPALGDYNGDGRSDLAVALVDRSAGTTAWLARLTGNGAPLFYSFHHPGDAYITGRFYAGNKRYYPGIVYVRSASTPLEWYIKNPQGSENTFQFGLPGDTVPNQGDVDCDGITDIIVARNGTGDLSPYKIWYIAKSTGGQVSVLFGLAGDKIGVADINGDHCMELVALRSDSYVWYSRSLNSSAIREVQWGLPGDIPLLPMDLDGNEKADYVIVRPSENYKAYERLSSTRFKTFSTGPDGSIPTLGKFIRKIDFAIHNRNESTVSFRRGDGSWTDRPFGIPSNIVIAADGSAFLPTETGQFGGASTQPSPGSGSCTSPTFPDGSGGALWKPVSEGGHYSGNPTFLGSNSIQSVQILSSSGSVVTTMPLRYYNGPGNRSVWDCQLSASALAQYAPITIKATYSDHCEARVVPDPRSRVD